MKAELSKAGITPDQNIICYCGTSREGSLIYFTLKHVLGYPNVRLYEGSWKEYVWVKGKSLPAETGGNAGGK
jgi:thiosulfate/3-mercaptopyruvate sulfurtransferase